MSEKKKGDVMTILLWVVKSLRNGEYLSLGDGPTTCTSINGALQLVRREDAQRVASYLTVGSELWEAVRAEQ